MKIINQNLFKNARRALMYYSETINSNLTAQ